MGVREGVCPEGSKTRHAGRRPIQIRGLQPDLALRYTYAVDFARFSGHKLGRNRGSRVDAFWQFHRVTIAGTLAATLAIAFTTWIYSAAAAYGVLGGGAAGACGFWYMANRAAKLASIPKDRIAYHVYRWTFIRMGFYAVVLTWAYSLDREECHALIAAVLGLLIVRVVMVVAGGFAARATARNMKNNVNVHHS